MRDPSSHQAIRYRSKPESQKAVNAPTTTVLHIVSLYIDADTIVASGTTKGTLPPAKVTPRVKLAYQSDGGLYHQIGAFGTLELISVDRVSGRIAHSSDEETGNDECSHRWQ